ncbi:MAG: DNA repair protein RecO, partial [Steroidobacteraceae bacterium]
NKEALAWLDGLARAELEAAGTMSPAVRVRKEARALLYAFAEYHVERKIRSLPHLARTTPTAT